jgi:hypothetical protein
MARAAFAAAFLGQALVSAASAASEGTMRAETLPAVAGKIWSGLVWFITGAGSRHYVCV